MEDRVLEFMKKELSEKSEAGTAPAFLSTSATSMLVNMAIRSFKH